jgi:acyl carrier protein
MSDWPNEFDLLLRAHLPLLGTETALGADDRLADLGLDSMGTVSLLIELEDAFEVSIPDELLTTATFDTPAALWKVIGGLRDA